MNVRKSKHAFFALIFGMTACAQTSSEEIEIPEGSSLAAISYGVPFDQVCMKAAGDDLIVVGKNGRDPSQIPSISALVSRTKSLIQPLGKRSLASVSFHKLSVRGLPSAEVLRSLKYDKEIELVEPNCEYFTSDRPVDTYYGTRGAYQQTYLDLWGLAQIKAETAWDIANGEGITVAISDTGVDYNHTDIDQNIAINAGEDLNKNGVADMSDFNNVDDDNDGFVDNIRGWDFVNNDNNPMDDNLHGTHVAGTVAAEGNNNTGIVGVAYKAKILPIKGLNAAGAGDTQDLIDSITYAATMKANVINMSWGGPGMVSAFCLAINSALNQGAISVVASGNDNANANGYSPAACNNVISVSSLGENLQPAPYSNFGSTVTLAGPGGASNDILSLLSDGAANPPVNLTIGNMPGNRYLRINGTSMASPHVAGIVALMLSKNKDLTLSEVRDILKSSAQAIAADPTKTYGAGLADATKALQMVGPANRSPQFLQMKDMYNAVVGSNFEIKITATDPDEDTVDLIPVKLPGDAVYDTVKHTLTWTPQKEDADKVFQIQFDAKDDKLSTSFNATISVLDNTVNTDDPSLKANSLDNRNNVESSFGPSCATTQTNSYALLIMILICLVLLRFLEISTPRRNKK